MNRIFGSSLLVFAGVVGVLAITEAATAGVSLPDPPGSFRGTVAAYHFDSPAFKIDSKHQSDVFLRQIALLPGQSTGWHTHPGPELVVITQGTSTLYVRQADGTCTAETFQVGQAFFTPPGEVHMAKNNGMSTTLKSSVTLIGMPVGAPYRSAQPAPADSSCPAS